MQGILEGSKRPHARTLYRLAQGLGVSADEFFLDPARLVYRRFDRDTNPQVADVVADEPALFEGWDEADFEELHSRFGTGGPLTAEGARQAAVAMNRNRQTHDKLAVLLETNHAEMIRSIVDVVYAKAVGEKP